MIDHCHEQLAVVLHQIGKRVRLKKPLYTAPGGNRPLAAEICRSAWVE